MSGIEYIVFRNSFQSTLIIPIHSEFAWFAARDLGNNMLIVTVMAVLGATLAMSANFFLGYWLSGKRSKRINMTEETYQKISMYFRRYVVLLLLFPTFYFVGLIAVACGFFRVRPWIAISVAALGRAGYYSYQLLQPL